MALTPEEMHDLFPPEPPPTLAGWRADGAASLAAELPLICWQPDEEVEDPLLLGPPTIAGYYDETPAPEGFYISGTHAAMELGPFGRLRRHV